MMQAITLYETNAAAAAAVKRVPRQSRRIRMRNDAWRYRAMMAFAAYGWTAASLMAEQAVELLSRSTEGTLGIYVAPGEALVGWVDRPGSRLQPFAGLVERIIA